MAAGGRYQARRRRRKAATLLSLYTRLYTTDGYASLRY